MLRSDPLRANPLLNASRCRAPSHDARPSHPPRRKWCPHQSGTLASHARDRYIDRIAAGYPAPLWPPSQRRERTYAEAVAVAAEAVDLQDENHSGWGDADWDVLRRVPPPDLIRRCPRCSGGPAGSRGAPWCPWCHPAAHRLPRRWPAKLRAHWRKVQPLAHRPLSRYHLRRRGSTYRVGQRVLYACPGEGVRPATVLMVLWKRAAPPADSQPYRIYVHADETGRPPFRTSAIGSQLAEPVTTRRQPPAARAELDSMRSRTSQWRHWGEVTRGAPPSDEAVAAARRRALERAGPSSAELEQRERVRQLEARLAVGRRAEELRAQLQQVGYAVARYCGSLLGFRR